LAGGIGSRIGSETPKQFLSLQGKLIVEYSLDFFLAHPEVSEIILVCERSLFDKFLSSEKYPEIKLVQPGFTRAESMVNGFHAVSAAGKSKLVAVHDAARPFVDEVMLNSLLNAIKVGDLSGVIPAVKSKNTLKLVRNGEIVDHTVDRTFIREAQTPQIFKYSTLHTGISKLDFAKDEPTDESSIVEGFSEVQVVEGDEMNIKITSIFDLLVAKAILEYKSTKID
jgi:2-C-methyl-D-erythritol 4-phosphate cytidylyltransferase